MNKKVISSRLDEIECWLNADDAQQVLLCVKCIKRYIAGKDKLINSFEPEYLCGHCPYEKKAH